MTETDSSPIRFGILTAGTKPAEKQVVSRCTGSDLEAWDSEFTSPKSMLKSPIKTIFWLRKFSHCDLPIQFTFIQLTN